MIRDCRRHGRVPFGLYRTGPGRGSRWICTKCASEAVTRRHQKVKRLLIDENGGCCAACGYGRTPFNLHFHHVDPRTKDYAVNMARGKSLTAFRTEAAKCVLVCANCHGEIEAGLIPSPPPGAKFGEDWTAVSAPPIPEPAAAALAPQLELFESEEEST